MGNGWEEGVARKISDGDGKWAIEDKKEGRKKEKPSKLGEGEIN